MLEFYTSNYHKARKEYKCDLCHQPIAIGEKYHRYTGKYDGDMFDFKYHIECQNIIDEFCDENGEREYDYDWISTWLHEKYCYDCIHGNNKQGDCNEAEVNCTLIREQRNKVKQG